MDIKRLFKILSYLIVFVFLLNYIAVRLYLYNSLWWFDMPMHFIGGFWVGLAMIWLFRLPELSEKFIFKCMLGVLIVGIGWELYEILINNILAQNPFNILDTVSDVFFDLSGGLCAILYVWKRQ